MIKAENIVWHNHRVSRENRQLLKGHKSCILWFTGLPSSGKSTIANEVEFVLNQKGVHFNAKSVIVNYKSNFGFPKK